MIMNKDRFWAIFGMSIAWGMLLSVVIAIIELLVSIRFSTSFGLKDISAIFGACTFVLGILGIVLGIADNENRKSGFAGDKL